MNTRAFTLALALAAMSMFLVWTYVEQKRTDYIKEYGTGKVVVIAKQDIAELELLDNSKLETREIPSSFEMPGAFNSMKGLENTIATVPILKGEQITKPRVTYPGAKTGLSRQVVPGKRAVSININEQIAVSKLVRPGDRVDILAAIDYASRKDKQKVKTILQDILVLSTGLSMTNSIPIIGIKTPKEIKRMNLNTYSRYNTVTLELSPFQMQKLVYIINFGASRPYLALRNNSDKAKVNIKSTQIFDMLGDNEKLEAKKYFLNKYKSGR